MKTKEKKSEIVVASSVAKQDLQKMSFDDIMKLDEKERKKLASQGQEKNSKRLQLISQVGTIKNEISTLETKYIESLTNPSINSIDLKVQIKCKLEEEKIAQEIFMTLFPENEKAGSMCVIS